MQNRDLFSFNIPKYVRYQLIKCNYYTVADFDGVSLEKLCSDTLLPKEDCESVLTRITARSEFPPTSAALQLSVECQLHALSTGSSLLDQLLGGGVQMCAITEFCGMSASGKTQMCLKLTANCLLHHCNKDGERNEVVYIDTEGSFTVERLLDIVKAATENHSKLKQIDGTQDLTDKLISRIHYTRCTNLKTLLNKINGLQQFLINNLKVRLVIIDNITIPIRLKFDTNYMERNSVLQQIVLTLLKLAKKYELAVVFTNQMTTKIVEDENMHVVPSLGAHWSHCVSNRVLLEYKNGEEMWSATLEKSSYGARKKCLFDIGESGICNFTKTTM